MRTHELFFRKYSRMLLLIVPAIPLVVVNSFIFPFVTSKAFAFFLLVEGAFALALFGLRNHITIRIGVISGLVLALAATMIVTTLLSTNIHLHFWGDVERMDGLFLWLHLITFFFLTIALFETRQWQIFFIASFVVGALVALCGIAQHNGSIPLLNEEGRIDVLFGNPVFLSLFLLFNIGIGLLLFVRSKRSGYMRAVIGFALAMHILAFFYTGTRGAFLAFLAAIAVGCVTFAISPSASARIRYICGSMVILTFLMVGAIVFLNDHPIMKAHPVLERFSVISLSNIQNQARFFIWEAAFDGIATQPLRGHGFEGFSDVFLVHVEPSYFGEQLSSLPQPWTDRAHNVFLDIGNSVGLLAVLLYISIGLYTVYILFSTDRLSDAERSILIALVVAYTIHSTFSFNTFIGYIWILSVVAYVSSFDTSQYVHTIPIHKNILRPIQFVGVAIVLIAVVSVGERAIFAFAVRSVHNETDVGSYTRFTEYVTLAEHVRIDRPYVLSELPYIGMGILTSDAADATENAAMLDTVQYAEQTLRSYGPMSVKDLYYYGQFYRLSDAYKEAEQVLQEAYARAPEHPLILMQLGWLALEMDQTDVARTYMRQAYYLEPTFKDAVIAYATSLMHANEEDRANEVIEEYFGSGVMAADKIHNNR